ncbi:hypothetical protein AB0G64_34720 [Streptomyces longwoodensis]|uniref:hypothetical protein n=1 Tax=Streptomyces longwoodensis TaxID=68231 RepID=UPI0033C568C5
MLLDPPGMLPAHLLPHWPYLQAVDAALAGRGIPPGAVRISRSGREHGELMTMRLYWDAGRTGGHGGVRLAWEEETGWEYALVGLAQDQVIITGQVDALHRIYAAPEDVAEVAEHMVRTWRRPAGDFHQEWEQAAQTRTAIDAFRRPSPSEPTK